MDFCTNCGEKLSESSKFCTNCGLKVAKDNIDMSSPLKTRMEKKKNRSKTRLIAGVGSITGLLLVISVTLMVKDFHKPESKSNAAATKTMDHSKDKAVENKDQSSHESSNLSASDHILPASDKRVMREEDITNLTKEQLRLARNEIYARHGHVFKSQDLQNYFSSKSWYHPDPSFDGSLNEVEKENVDFIKAREDSPN
ncbi:YARHG domain-containing protein [Neobacillus sp. NRS-1170]|uniref:YARHG domain-containing protein n=1 Tax=Neobacillus sp. NRS-1170 TaxID=3233898 RepID=UPI003D2B5534